MNRTARWIGIALSALFVVSLSCGWIGAVSTVRLPESFSVRVMVTPGKPGAATEEVGVEFEKENCNLTVQRVQGTTILKREAALGIDDCKVVWREASRLRSFKPRQTAQRGFDFGARSIQISYACLTSSRRCEQQINWDQSLVNEASLKPLSERMKMLVQRSVPDILLYYF